ncbi:SDR family oxidoreductase [Kineococcus sp. SYSU DK001]|uniref:SDR family oxidoreductase n=1 Tax=Kineococcus sp. SYSU DK001 TaxID=3383122 RepID=UPI003D7E07E9
MNTRTQTALVTGANKGIGLEIARQLARAGLTVWLGSRDRERGDAAARELSALGDVRALSLDVTDEDSLTAAAARVEEESGVLDVLVNNAGTVSGSDGPPSTVPVDAVRNVFDVNFHGPLRVVQAFLPLVRRAPAGRVVNVSSTMGSLTTLAVPGNPLVRAPFLAYPASKTALNSLTVWLAAELQGTPIKVNSVCPGINATDMNSDPSGQHPSEGAEVAVRAALLPADGPTGTFFDVSGPVPW